MKSCPHACKNWQGSDELSPWGCMSISASSTLYGDSRGIDHIDRAGIVGQPAYGAVIADEKRTLQGQSPAQIVKQLAKVGAGLGLTGLGP